jgi:hypothetical protein
MGVKVAEWSGVVCNNSMFLLLFRGWCDELKELRASWPPAASTETLTS